MSHPAIRLVAYDDRGDLVFVAVPNERGRYMRTHRSVVEVPCPACSAVCGEPCKGHLVTYSVGTHYKRRKAWSALRRQKLADAIAAESKRREWIEPPEVPALGTVGCDDIDVIVTRRPAPPALDLEVRDGGRKGNL